MYFTSVAAHTSFFLPVDHMNVEITALGGQGEQKTHTEGTKVGATKRRGVDGRKRGAGAQEDDETQIGNSLLCELPSRHHKSAETNEAAMPIYLAVVTLSGTST